MIDPLPSDIFRPGQVLNNTYEIEGVLGRGGTGEVYRATNQVTGRTFAIKALNAQFSRNADYLELMKREEEMRSILHDAVVRYNECSRTDDGHVYLVMDYIAGPSLAEAMMDRRMDPRELLIIAHRVAEGLVATHRNGIVHRDLSPDNIILRDGEAEKATIIDFGIAKDTAAGARTIVGNEFAGKYEYAAPEQLDGHSEPRTDLYSLGATLLAAYRQETPYLGTTPGEIVRRKQTPLETDGVPEPLGGFIDRLTMPHAEDRPSSAAEAVRLIDDLLRPLSKGKDRASAGSTSSASRARKKTRRRGLPVLAGALALAGGGAAIAWAAGLFDALLTPPLPLASPYVLEASAPAGGAPSLVANAPDEAVSGILRRAFASATGAPVGSGEISIATGMPMPEWHELAAELMARAAELDDWSLGIKDRSVVITGVASGRAQRDALVAGFQDFSRGTGMDIRPSIAAGPLSLPVDILQATIDDFSTCGALTVEATGTLALGEEVRVTGDFADGADISALRNSLGDLVGDRPVRVQGTVLNEQLCAIRAVLPPASADTLSIWLGNGVSEAANLTGVYRTGENPVVEIHTPANIEDGYLWVMIVDNTGKVFHVLPNVNDTEQRLGALGEVVGGIRKIRVLCPIETLAQNPQCLAIRITEGDYGKSEVLAVLSSRPLFDMRRPRDESVASVAGALGETLRGREREILGVAARIIDARP